VRNAVSLGLNVLDADYEKLDVDVANSESDDDEDTPVTANPKTPVMFERKVSANCQLHYVTCIVFRAVEIND